MGKNWHRKYTRKNLKNDTHHKNSGYFWIWVIMILIVIGFIYVYNPTINKKVNNFFEDIPMRNTSQIIEKNSLSSCKEDWNKYSKIGAEKKGHTFNFINIQEINNKQEFDDYMIVYGGYDIFDFPDGYPFVLISYSYYTQNSIFGGPVTISTNIVCINGTLTEKSIKQLVS